MKAKVVIMNMPFRVLRTSLLFSLGLAACVGVETTPPDQERSTVLEAPPPERFGNYPWARHGGNYMYNFYFPPSPSSTPWAPAWSPDGTAIAVGMAGSIWAIDPTTGVATELTRGTKYHSSPTWSPDGNWIIYTADDGGNTIQLEILNVQSGETHSLTDDEFIYVDPVFSPDGSRVAYVSTEPSGYFNVYIRSIRNGQWSGEVAAVSSDNNFGRARLYFGDQDMHINPSWLPNGNELLLVSNRDVALGSGNVIRVPAEANGMAQRQTVLAEQTLYRARPDVSIDGKRFIYSSTSGTADQFNNLYVQPTVGGEPYKLTFFQHDAFHPRWSPDGEWIAFISNEGGLPQLELLETYGGSRRRINITERRWKEPMGTLKVTVRADGATTAARVLLTAADGKFYAPSDSYARIAQRGGFHMFHTTGNFTIELPPGSTDLTVMKGFELYPERRQIEVRAGEITTVEVTLRRMTDLSTDGWHNGSTHVHTNYAGNLHNTLENMMMMSDGEDQDIVNELIANKDNRILDYQFFIPGGEAHPLSTPDRVLVVGEEYRPPFYGHVFMLGLEDHLISPFTTGYEGTAIESLYPSNTDMFRKAKAQGATTGYVHAFRGNADPLAGNLGGAKGFLVDAALGTVDALEWVTAGSGPFYPVYAAWSNDIRITAVGGEDAISSLHWTATVGATRTYVRPDDRQRTMDGWLKGLRDGHAFVTNGPLVELTVNGSIAGETLELPTGTGTVSVTARVRSITPLMRAFIVHNGEEVAEVPLSENRQSGGFEGEVEITGSGWIHLRAVGAPEESFPLDASFAQGFTNPVWIMVGGAPIRDRASAEYGIQWVDKLTEMALEWPDWRSQTEIDHVLEQFQEARALYEELAEEAGRM
ncbi:MAG: CehA/McbA family metallohydrolase [Gemmatimonadota bacterium]|nr:CehA/McbA family metallohydrolase [Gemmatimonadota bacterium]